MSNLFRSIVLLTMLCVSATATADAFYDTYQHGLAAFKAKEYANARAEFLRAYDLRAEPVILFNVAQTYRLELSPEQALVYYRRFLAESKIAAELRDSAQAYIAELEAELKTRDAQNKLDAPAPPMDRPAPSLKIRSGDAATRHSSPVWSTRRKIALVTATGSVLALAAGTLLGMSARSRESDAHALCADPRLACDGAQRANDLLRSGHHRAIGADVAFGVGAAAAIASGVLWLTGAPETHDRVAVAPVVSSEQVVVTISGRF